MEGKGRACKRSRDSGGTGAASARARTARAGTQAKQGLRSEGAQRHMRRTMPGTAASRLGRLTLKETNPSTQIAATQAEAAGYLLA